MSSYFQPRRKEYANVQVMSSESFWAKRKELKLVGCVSRSLPCFLTTTHDRKTGQCSFKDDVSALTFKTKNEIANFFSSDCNSKKTSVYLAIDKSKSNGIKPSK